MKEDFIAIDSIFEFQTEDVPLPPTDSEYASKVVSTKKLCLFTG